VIPGVVVHVAPEQHPVLHVAESHPVHTFAMHDPFEGQLWQAAPPEPQLFASTLSTQAAPLQHPVQVDPSQTHLPPAQCCPVAHTRPPPHVQTPVDEHPSPTVTPATTQESWHAEPFAPHAVPVVGVTHAGGLPWQQPFGHDVGSQMHAPPEHRSPTPQAAPGPQVQTPDGEQVSASLATHGAQALPMPPQALGVKGVHTFPVQHPVGHVEALHTQAPPEQTCPATQGAEVPQRHAPALEQLSAVVELHGPQATPATPHVANADVVQFAPAQQPFGQLVGVQPVHTPPSSQF
jgi:hypothetical protein